MLIAHYLRVSTEDQAKEGYSLEVQREYLESFAQRESLEIFKVYQDDGISGYSTERPALGPSLMGTGRPTPVGLKELLKDTKEKNLIWFCNAKET